MTEPKIRPLPMRNICTQKWRDMSGTHLTRHCDQCDKQVHNLSALPQAEALAFVEAHRADNICVRYECDAEGDMVFLGSIRPKSAHPEPTQSLRKEGLGHHFSPRHLSTWALSVGLSLSLMECASPANTTRGATTSLSNPISERIRSKMTRLSQTFSTVSTRYSSPGQVHGYETHEITVRYRGARDDEVAGGSMGFDLHLETKRIQGTDSPAIPDELVQLLKGQEGQIHVLITLNRTTGNAQFAIAHSDLPPLNNLVLEHVKSWKFKPGFSSPRHFSDLVKGIVKEEEEEELLQPFYFTFKPAPQ